MTSEPGTLNLELYTLNTHTLHWYLSFRIVNPTSETLNPNPSTLNP